MKMEKKSFTVTAFLALFFRPLGVHRFYTGHIGTGIIQLLTIGGCGIWAFIDLILICTGKFKDANGQELANYDKNLGYVIIGVVLATMVIAVMVNVILQIFGIMMPDQPN